MADWKRLVRDKLGPLRLTPTAETELVDEIAQHLDDLQRELRSGGATPEDAYRETVAELDDIYALRRGLDRNQHMPLVDPVPAGAHPSGSWLEDLARDLRHASRMMRANPGFVLFVVLTLGLGIGANTTVFSLINRLILNPIPVHEPANLLAFAAVESVASPASAALLPLSYPNFQSFRAGNDVFASVGGYTGKRVVTLQTQGAAQGMLCEFVTGDYFPALGVRAAAGRLLQPQDDDAPGVHAVAILNHGAWQRRFGGRAEVIGSELRLNGVAVTVIGITPPGFLGVNGLVGPDVWLPFSMAETLLPAEMRGIYTDRAKPMLQAIARLRPGVSSAGAQGNLTAIASGLARDYPATNDGYTVAVRPIVDVTLGAGSQTLKLASFVLVAVVGIVLLIACSNVANLLLARAAGRSHEMSVRIAMGASRARLMRQMLTESTCLGLLSGAAGLLIGYAGTQLLSRTVPMSGTFVAPGIDGRVLLFTLAASLLTGLAFGIVPAVNAARASVAGALGSGRIAGQSRRKVTIGRALLVGQVALSFLLLVTASLFLRSISQAYDIDPGFQTSRLAVFLTNPGQAGYDDERSRAFYRELRDRVAALPGIEGVSWSSNLPLWARAATGVHVEGQPTNSRTDTSAAVVLTVDHGYFAVSGIALARGRDFTGADHSASLPVAIVNDKFAQDYWPGQDALGRRVQVPGETVMRQVVGVSRNANYTTWAETPQRCVYVPLDQHMLPAMALYVRSASDPKSILVPVGQAIAAAAPQVLVSGVRTGSEIVDGGLFQARMGVMLLGVFGALALGLASMGLYGNLAYAVTERRREIGVRMALGANRSSVRRLILRQGLTLVLVGVVIGLAAALVTGRALGRLLFGVGGSDPVSLAAAGAVLSLVALCACYLPARRATRVDPLMALRQE
jgi:predicted permease